MAIEHKGLLFIPDISGFTRFINETEIDHSRLIIKELLEILIDANEIGLEISEIEGDAILFYKFGEPPGLEDLYRQVEKMFRVFHQGLIAYDQRKYCLCKACLSAINLSLKVITHYGEFADYKVGNFSKLIGKDIIVAHQLLKNDIEKHEYWLVTQGLYREQAPTGFEEWMEWNRGVKEIEAGPVPFHYAPLTRLKEKISSEPLPPIDLASKRHCFSVSREYNTDLITLFHAAGDLRYRSRWQHGVVSVEEINHFLPRVGMRFRKILSDGEVVAFASSYRYSPEKIEFSETDEHSNNLTWYTLEALKPDVTRLTLDFYVDRGRISTFLFGLFEKRPMEKSYRQSLGNIVEVLKDIHIPPMDLPSEEEARPR